MDSEIKDKINSAQYLYYYTTIDTLIKIIGGMRIKYGKGTNMNDMFESDRHIYYSDIDADIESAFKDEMAKYEQISFSIDSKSPKGLKGFEIPPMWGHYSSKGNGVCIALDKYKLIDEHIVRKGKIRYSNDYNGDIIVHCATISEIPEYISNNLKELFFTKSKSWAYEQEYRIISYIDESKDHFLDITNSISFILISLFEDWNMIQRIADKIPVYEYGHFIDQRGIRDTKGNSIWSSFDFSNFNIDI